jgi:two-component system NarL family sensor kinase
VGWFTVAGILALVITGAATAVAGHQAGEREAIVDLRAQTLGLARLRIQPTVTDPLVEGNITAVGKVGAAVRHFVINDDVARVKIWNKNGTIVYSDDARLIGTHQPLDPDQIAAMRPDAVRSKIADSSAPENRFERSEGKLLQVDLRINTPKGQPLLLQVFYRYRTVTDAGTHVWNRFAPYALGALAALAFVLWLVGCLLARRLRPRRRKVAPEPEVAETEAEPAEPPARSVAVEPVAEPEVVVVLAEPEHEPDPGTDFVDALSHLLAHSNGGVASMLDTHNVHDTIPPAIATMLYRATKETLRNHDHTTPVTVRVSDRDNVATLDVENGGASSVDLRALTDLVADSGGHLLVDAAENGRTRVHVEVPLPPLARRK